MNPDVFDNLDKYAGNSRNCCKSEYQTISETIESLWEMIDGKCCHRDFIKDVTDAINALEKIRKCC